MTDTPYNLLLLIDTENPTDDAVMAFLHSQYQVLTHQTPLEDLEVDPTPLDLAPQYEPLSARKIVPPDYYWVPELSLAKWRHALAYIKPVNNEPLPVVIQNRLSFRQIMMISLVEYVEPISGLNVATFNEEIEATMQMYDVWAKGLRLKNTTAQARHRAAQKEKINVEMTPYEKALVRSREHYKNYSALLSVRKQRVEAVKLEMDQEIKQAYHIWQASKSEAEQLQREGLK